jgi:hypothetical protein
LKIDKLKISYVLLTLSLAYLLYYFVTTYLPVTQEYADNATVTPATVTEEYVLDNTSADTSGTSAPATEELTEVITE